MSSEFCVVLTTTDDEEIANKIASYLIEENLANCVQIDQVISFFKWKGGTKQTREFRLMVKASTVKYAKIEKAIVATHNYNIPEIVKLDITGGSSQYLSWVADDN